NDIIKADLSITRSDVLENVVLAAHFTNSCMHSNDEPTITYSPSAVGVTSQSIQYRMNGILVDYPSIVTKNNEQTIPFGITGKRYLSLNSTLNNNFSDDRNIFSNINLTTEYDANRHSFQLNSGRYNYELQIRRGEYVYPSENRTFSYTYSSQNLVSNINYSNLSGISPNSIFENREMSYLVDSLKSTNFRYATFRIYTT
ncbi:MAG: hypothetical protein RML35_00860, partial [Chloroherpetonaceae bacterium]|nr:hypothetical protein [Chloroherpetonaceae bacterium]